MIAVVDPQQRVLDAVGIAHKSRDEGLNLGLLPQSRKSIKKIPVY